MRHTLLCALILCTSIVTGIHACASPAQATSKARTPQGEVDASVRDLCVRYSADREAIDRFYDVRGSQEHDERLKSYDKQTLSALDALEFDALGVEGRVDWTLLHRHIQAAERKIEIDRAKTQEIKALVPFADAIATLRDAQRRVEPGAPEAIASTLEAIRADVEKARKDAEAAKDKWTQPLARRGARRIQDLKNVVDDWYHFRADYDPDFTWWTKKPFEALDHALDDHLRYVRETLGGEKPDADKDRPIVGDPIGRDALLADLDAAMIPATPEELLAIADKEMAWCTQRMLESSRAMGCGDDWKAALERVKQDHVAPGEQPKLIADLAHEATAFVEKNELVTVPPLCAETWRISMLSPDDQRQSPFFLGGEDIQVAFPTDSMTNDEKRMSMRGNNRHFAHATVFHELIPGHCLQAWYEARANTHRRMFSTPFYTEGWALYWEMLMWDKGFDTTPEDRVGALFWRMHRCARIHFSLQFHLGQMTPQACVDYLVENVGHERKNAEAEVRRSFEGGYGPLYQLAYMTGGLQLRALHHEAVEGGKMTDRAFHDAVLEGANMPIEMVRARVMGMRVGRDWKPGWRFWETR